MTEPIPVEALRVVERTVELSPAMLGLLQEERRLHEAGDAVMGEIRQHMRKRAGEELSRMLGVPEEAPGSVTVSAELPWLFRLGPVDVSGG